MLSVRVSQLPSNGVIFSWPKQVSCVGGNPSVAFEHTITQTTKRSTPFLFAPKKELSGNIIFCLYILYGVVLAVY